MNNENNEREEFMYGYFPGGDPRDFTPDYELCAKEEIEAWKADVEAAERGDTVVCPPSGQWLFGKDGKAILHILAPRYGIGTYIVRLE